MPNFNGAIIMHTMELLNSPATLREIVVTISQNTELPPEDIKLPVKQTLEMGLRSGFLQKAEGRYYLEPITFTHLMSEMKALEPSDLIEKPQRTKADKSLKTSSKIVMQKITNPEAMKNSKPLYEGTHRTSNTKPKRPLNEGSLLNPKLQPRKSLLDNSIFKSSSPLPKVPLLDNISIAGNIKTISDSKKKSMTSLSIKPKRVNNRQ